MSMPLGITALGAVGVIAALTYGKSARERAKERHKFEAPGVLGLLETDPAVRPCPAFSRCSWDRALRDSYERCQRMQSPAVKRVCMMSTDGYALGGDVATKVGGAIKDGYNAIKGLF